LTKLINFRRDLILGLLWQIIRLQVLSDVTVEAYPELNLIISSSDDNESRIPEKLLLKWMNFHLEGVEPKIMLKNFSSDLQVMVMFIYILVYVLWQIMVDPCPYC
jgi:hypothetical protein